MTSFKSHKLSILTIIEINVNLCEVRTEIFFYEFEVL